KIKCLYRQIITLNLKILSQLFITFSEVYTSSETAAYNKNSNLRYTKLRDLLKNSLSENLDITSIKLASTADAKIM
ncbi:hypothetical protein BDBG_16177, partial [Blastomyces gilchristii SLH14081]